MNNTLLGRGNTNDNYFTMSQHVDWRDFFINPETTQRLPIDFIYKRDSSIIAHCKYKKDGNELRIYGMGDFHRKINVNPGDELLLEMKQINGEKKYFIDNKPNEKTLVLQPNREDFEILNPELLDECLKNINKGNKIVLEFRESRKKTVKSPSETDFYSLKVNGNLLKPEDLKMVFLKWNSQQNMIKKIKSTWTKIVYQVEG